MTVPAELPGTSLICISIFPNKYSVLDWKPEPEDLSKERVRSCPLLSIFPRPFPQATLTSLLKSAAENENTAARRAAKKNILKGDIVVCTSVCVLLSLVRNVRKKEERRELYIVEGGEEFGKKMRRESGWTKGS